MEPDSSDPNTSKTDMLRGVIAEKLTLAAREILAVVEKTVADYEEEAVGFRQEIDRQRRLLELLQPEVKLEALDDQQQFSLCEAGGGRLPEDQEQHKYEQRVEDSQSLGFSGYSEEQIEEDEHEDEDEEEEEEMAQQCYEAAPRLQDTDTLLVPSTVQTDRRRADRPWISETQSFVDLRIRILDSMIDVLSKRVFQKYPLHELQCRRGLQEADFLHLLRSTFPQLAADEPFDVFITDNTRKLQPLKIDLWTPEAIERTIRANGNSALYIRLKNQQSLEAEEELQPLHGNKAAAEHMRKRVGRPGFRKTQTHIMIRIRILGKMKSDVLSARVYQMCPLHELMCPRGLQEDDFVDLLRSTFPQLTADEPFDLFVSDKSRKLKPLKVRSLTTEEVERATRTSTLYIRLKPSEELQASAKQFLSVGDVLAETLPLTLKPTRKKPGVQSARRKPTKSELSEPFTHVDFRVRILEDPLMEVLTPQVFLKSRIQELRCPYDLQEADFLDQLRSSIPQLAAGKPFDILTADKSRVLQPLSVDTLTPAEIHRAITLRRNTTLFVRLKGDGPSTPNPTRLDTRVQSDKKNLGKPQLSRSDSHVDLKIRILEDSQVEVVAPQVFQNYPLHKLRCHRSLQEDDFLELLRSTFPQLAANVPFDILTVDKNRKLQPLNVESLTPEQVYKAIDSSRINTLFIRLKAPEKVQVGARKLEHLQKKVDTATESSFLPEQTVMHGRDQSDRRKPGRPRISQSSSHVDLRIRFVQDWDVNVISPKVYNKYPLHYLKCPRGLQEADFVELLKSTFPQLAADKPFDVLTADRNRRLQPLKVELLTPEELYRAIKASGSIVLFVRLKAPEGVQTSAKKLDLQRKVDGTEESPSFTEQTGLHMGSPHQPEENPVNIFSNSSTSRHKDVELKESEGGLEYTGLSTLQSLILYEHNELSDGLPNEKPNITNDHLVNGEPEKTKGNRRVKHSVIRIKKAKQKMLIHNSEALLSCKVCQILRGSTNMLIKHAWSHVDERERLCGVCGEQSVSAEQLRSHLQTHQKTHTCNICGKSFLTVVGYRGHLARHKGNTPYKCRTCHKAFPEKWVLKNHESRVHAVDKPHRKNFSKLKLKLHRPTNHAGGKPHSCNVCGKRFRHLDTLSQHVALHSGSTAATDRRIHTKNHSRERLFACDKCNKKFFHKSNVVTHMRIHTGEKPYKCTHCGKGFSQGHCVRRHLLIHQKKYHQQTEQLSRVETEDSYAKVDSMPSPQK
ncbi:uncharacterized protein LOC120720225 isoform X1 [Simochromis diagramma]|uniref:uncharacterized protein LOC120720225 isoform X1 n=2 Tax=Simochromis diagramma TaxID=43689 RepID=UPI001A7E7760|nr:uncharacterized protein LOC120720225 isoform X1 [Simochromis diagramma]